MNWTNKKHLLPLLTIGAIFSLAVCMAWAESGEPELIEMTFTSGFDKQKRIAFVQLPADYDEATPRPLLIWVQGMYTDAKYGMNYIGPSVSSKGWLVMTVDTRGSRSGGPTNLGAPVARRDILDAMDKAMCRWRVDPRRIYLIGMSMGALTGGLTLQDGFDRFAAGALLMGISDLKDWYYEEKPYPQINQDIVKECGGTPEEAPGEYADRSLLRRSELLAKIPLMVCHGRGDGTVHPKQAESLIQEILKHRPSDLYVYWFDGDHSEQLIDKMNLLDFLEQFEME